MKEVKIALCNGAGNTKVIGVPARNVNMALLRWHETEAGRDFMREHGRPDKPVRARLAEAAK